MSRTRFGDDVDRAYESILAEIERTLDELRGRAAAVADAA